MPGGIEVVGGLCRGFRDNLGDLLQRAALDFPLAPGIVYEVEGAYEGPQEDCDDDRVAGLPEGKPVE